MAWSEDHLKVITKIQTAVLIGGLFAMAMPRGTGKTSMVEVAAEWAILHGHSPFPALIGATEAHSVELLSSIKAELESNDLLLEDFPEACYPIRCLEGIANRCAGQLYLGKPTNITWTEKEIVLPTIPKSKSSGAIIKVAGITGRIRGMKYKRPDGSSVRPSLVIPDDPQTDESAKSLTQSGERERILAGAVLGLAGPGKKISGVMPCTVIRPGDMADRILDRDKHPEWNGERTKMVYAFPKNEKLWDTYRDMRHDGFRAGDNGAAATEFYRKNREEMDAGAVVAWKERHRPDELSAIQHAMNLMFRDKAAFFAEYQNEPLPDRMPESDDLTVDGVAGKVNGHKRGLVPIGCERITAFIDVQKTTLWWVVCGWELDFTGYVLDYGVFPEQKRNHFALSDVRYTLEKAFPGTSLEGWIYAGLDRLCDQLLLREWRRDDGSVMQISAIGRTLIDANWGDSTHVVKKFCRQSKHPLNVMPSHGRYVGAASKPLGEYVKQPGDQVGLNWRIPKMQTYGEVRHLLWDTNYWKSRTARAFSIAQGDKGCLSLFGHDPQSHMMFAEHMTSEYRVRTSGRGRELDEWRLHPNRDNHWWDCIVGCMVAASERGCEQAGTGPQNELKRKRVKLSEIQARKRQGR